MEKQSRGICPIAIGEVTYCLVVCTLAIQFRDTFTIHFGPHQFGVAIHSKCEIHDVRAMLDLHPNWVVLQVDAHNAFNSMSRPAIFQEL